jgi:hypothetical protein
MLEVFVILALGIAASAVQAKTTVWTGTGDWFASTGNWSEGVPQSNDVAVITSGAVRLTNATPQLASLTMNGGSLTFTNWATALIANEVTINNGASMTHLVNSATGTVAGVWKPDARVSITCSNLTIETGGTINADNVGYLKGKGPGIATIGAAGSGHSGPGRRNGTLGGLAYNDPDAPVQPGSGGYSTSGGNGGGAVRVVATGKITVRGTITANGQTASANHYGGGTGGSIWIDCRTFAGSATGLIRANGGGGVFNGVEGTGGRIAIHYNTSAQAALAEPSPPVRFEGKPGGHSNLRSNLESLLPDMATLYLPDTRLLTGAALSAKRLNQIRLVIPGFTEWAPHALTIDDCVFGLPEGLHVNVTNDMILTNGAALHLYAAPTADPLTLAGARLDVGGDLRIQANSWLVPYAHPTNGAPIMVSVSSDLLVAAGGGIDADYRGFAETIGPGLNTARDSAPGYGGRGGQTLYSGNGPGTVYGSVLGPVQVGTGGAVLAKGGKGGGVIRLTVAGDAVIDGLLTARGDYGLSNHGPGGSGGGIELDCHTLRGANTGLLRADGGQGNYSHASAGGGRIVIRYAAAAQAAVSPIPGVRFSTFAYTNTTTSASWEFWGEMGTLWLPDTSLLSSTPTGAAVLSNHRFWHTTLYIGTAPERWTPGSLTVSNCVVRFPVGYSLDVPGDVTIAGGGTLPADLRGTVEGRLALTSRFTNTLHGARLDVGNDLMIGARGWLWPFTCGTNGPAGTTNAIVGVRVEGDATVAAGGGIWSVGAGYIPRSANANGPGAGKSSTSGGGYGGKGGGALGGVTYGSASHPFEPGSPGGTFTLYNSGKGGGSVHLVARGVVTVDGLVSADGHYGAYYGGNGGSGGSVFLCGRKIAGAGVIRANGGARSAQVGSAGGGGGRIAIWRSSNPEQADEWIEMRRTDLLINSPSYPGFTGSLLADKGLAATADGTKGFYLFQGTLILIR